MSPITPYTGISGLYAYGRAFSVISNNIANVRSTGFKGSRTIFEDGPGQGSVGRGVQVGSVHHSFSQGSFESTSSPADLAIDGDGFFMVSRNGLKGYTRSGRFRPDKDGILVNDKGYALQGWSLDERGNITSGVGPISLTGRTSAPGRTSHVALHISLDANAKENPGGATFDVNRPLETSSYSTGVGVYDALGKEHFITVYFRKESPGQWSWHAVITGGEVIGQPNDYVAANGTLIFHNGRLQSASETEAFAERFAETTASQSIAFHFGSPLNADGSGGLDTTQFAGQSGAKFVGQDGHAPGDLQSIRVDQQGVISGLFSNGQARPLFQITLSRFTSAWGLKSVGGNLFSETNQSGPAIKGAAGSSGMGMVVSNALELSNVDLGVQFTEMIKTEHAFRANVQTIKTTDRMMQELIDLKA